MLANGNHHDVSVWLQTPQPSRVALSYWLSGSPDSKKSVIEHTREKDENIALITLTGLRAGSTYKYTITVGDRESMVAHPLQFSTQSLWRRRADPPSFTVAFGSCAYTNDPETDPPGKAYGGGYGIYETIRKQQPDFMLWLGDNVYLRAHDWSSRAGIFARYRRTRSQKPLQKLLASTFHYATWDDHDFGPNDSNWSYVLKNHTLDAFRGGIGRIRQRACPRLQASSRSFPGATWISFPRQSVLPFRVQCAGWSDKKLLGSVQFNWLMDALSASRAPFKVVAGGGQFLSPFDRWEGYAQFKTEQKRLIDTIVQRRIPGVVFLSGDRHHTELVKIKPEGFYPL